MIYIKDDEQSKELITKFLQQNNYMPTKIRFSEDSLFVSAAENSPYIDYLYASMTSFGARKVEVSEEIFKDADNVCIKD